MDKIFSSLGGLVDEAARGWRPGIGDLVMWPGRVALVVEGGWLIGDKLHGYIDEVDGEPLELYDFLESIA